MAAVSDPKDKGDILKEEGSSMKTESVATNGESNATNGETVPTNGETVPSKSPKKDSSMKIESVTTNGETSSKSPGNSPGKSPGKSPKKVSIIEPESVPSKEEKSPKKSSETSPKKSPEKSPKKSPKFSPPQKHSPKRSPKRGPTPEEEPPVLPPRERRPRQEEPKDEKRSDPEPEEVSGLGEVEWQSTKKTAWECLEYIQMNGLFTDVTFTFKGDPSLKITAHKLVLSMRSQVFEEILSGSMTVKDDATVKDDGTVKDDVIQVSDDPELFQMMLRFIYSDEIALDGETIIGCLSLARKYQLAGLIRKCKEFIDGYLSNANVLDVYTKCLEAELDDISIKCFDVMLQYGDKLLTPGKEGVQKLSKDVFLRLLSSDDLSCDEITVFEAALDWARHQCEQKSKFQEPRVQREELGDILFQIRFPLMSPEMIADNVAKSELLNSEELAMITEYVSAKDKSSDTKRVGHFSAVKRPGTGIVNIKMPQGKDMGVTSNAVLVIVPDNATVRLHAVVGKGFDCKGLSVEFGTDADKDCPIQVSENIINFTPPVALNSNATNLFNFSEIKGSTKLEYSKRVRNCSIVITHIPNNVDQIVLGFDDKVAAKPVQEENDTMDAKPAQEDDDKVDSKPAQEDDDKVDSKPAQEEADKVDSKSAQEVSESS